MSLSRNQVTEENPTSNVELADKSISYSLNPDGGGNIEASPPKYEAAGDI